MVQRHLTVPHRFVCFTDDTKDLNTKIDLRLLPSDNKYQGWWWKPYVFKQGHFDNGDTNLFIDLDMVIISNIDKLINYHPGKFLGLEDVSRVFKRGTVKLGSAVMRWPANEFDSIWTTIENNPNIQRQFHGDQDLIWSMYKHSLEFFPSDWIRSYKWEVRERSELIRNSSGWAFKYVRNPSVHHETAILAFHGTPNPHEVYDPIIVDNWC